MKLEARTSDTADARAPQASAGVSNSNGRSTGFTVFDLAPPNRRESWRHIPRRTFDAFALVWRADRRHLLITLGLQAAAGAALVLQLLVGRLLLQDLIALRDTGGSAASLLPEFALLIALTAILGGITGVVSYYQRLLVEFVGRHTFERIVGVGTDVDLAHFESPDFYDQLQRAKTSGLYKPIEMVNSLSTLMTGFLTSLGLVAVLFFVEPILVPLIALAAVPVLISTIHNSRQSYTFEYEMTPESRERMYVMDLLTGRQTAKEVRVFAAGAFFKRRYALLTDARLARLREFIRRRLIVSLLGTTAGAIGMGIAMGSLLYLLVHGDIDAPSALIAAVAMQQLGARLNLITASAGRLIEAGMFIDDYNAFLELASEVPADEGASLQLKSPRAPFQGVAVEHVSFAYPATNKTVLDDISIKVEPGQVVALVGENGSGKTTLVKLLCQLYQPTQGRILWNGVDARELPAGEIRNEMTVLFQDFIQYHLSARENIALGRIERLAEQDDVIRAADRAGAGRFVTQLPDGYETRLGRQFYGGHELSVGQWQRLALARAFFRDAAFLVLDEPTASLDPRAEADLFAQMRSLSAGRTVLLVSHRFSSVRNADRIYVLEHGRTTEAGTHDELLARDGHYAELFNLQAAAYLGGEQKP